MFGGVFYFIFVWWNLQVVWMLVGFYLFGFDGWCLLVGFYVLQEIYQVDYCYYDQILVVWDVVKVVEFGVVDF